MPFQTTVEVGGTLYVWADPARTVRHIFVRRSPDATQLPEAGVLIVADPADQALAVIELTDLSRQLPVQAAGHPTGSKFYWASERNLMRRQAMLKELTSSPIQVA